MKKHVACVMLMILGLIILGLVQIELDSYSNQMTLKVTKENSEVQLQKESCQTTLGTIKAYYSMSETTLLERSLQVKYIEEDYTDFMEEEDKAFVAGGYFTEADFEKQKPYIIIDESVAIRYFGTINCIGESLDIDKVTYSVIGVVAPRFSLGNIINHQLTTVYVPYDFYKGKTWCYNTYNTISYLIYVQ